MDEVIASVEPALRAKIGAYRREHRLPGIVAGVASRHGLAWWHANGFADIEAGRRAMSGPFTGWPRSPRR